LLFVNSHLLRYLLLTAGVLILSTPNPQSMLILYAEDDSEDFEVFCEALKIIDPKVVCMRARDGAEALSILNETVVLPDYIFLDINMPVMDGKSCLIELKRNDQFEKIPVIMYTTSNRDNEIQEFTALGAKDYIIKPSTFDEVHKVLGRILNAA
jgi:CheY-like chemotaxis protein